MTRLIMVARFTNTQPRYDITYKGFVDPSGGRHDPAISRICSREFRDRPHMQQYFQMIERP